MHSPSRQRTSTGKATVVSGAPTHRAVRCAIYTRKSTEEGLEQAFNSLDAQREACAAYIASQRHEGWVETSEIYDDGGFSGGNMERPGLRQLMADVQAGRVDVIVVYKVDRLTRALSDFARIVEVLDAAGASFVSVTQSFNTTTSMGRLTLNVLLSFAQFEREVTGERIRDKIAASKKKGMWMGGPVPLGYVITNCKLLADPDEAETVRYIFSQYAKIGSIRDLGVALADEGVLTKQRPMRDGRMTGGTAFARGGLVHLLRNPVYIGEVHHHGNVYPGEHDGIIDRDLWDSVQGLLDDNTVERKTRRNVRHISLLAGMIHDGLRRKMSPSHANKGPRRFRYYVTHSDGLAAGGPTAWRLPAHDLEQIVVARTIAWLGTSADVVLAREPDADAALIEQARHRAGTMITVLTTGSAVEQQTTLQQLIERIDVQDTQVDITIIADSIMENGAQATLIDTILITAPATRVRRGDDIRLIVGATDPAVNRDEQLIALVAEARQANATLLDSKGASLDAVADAQGHARRHFSRLLRLAYLAPDIIGRIIDGTQPPSLTRTRLLSSNDVPLGWVEQRHMFGFPVAA